MALISEYKTEHFQLYHAVDEPPRREDYEMHMHDHYEMYCFISGNARYHVEGTSYQLSGGTLLLMRNSESHTLMPSGPDRYERYTLNFRRELFEGTGFTPSLLRPFHDRALGEGNLYLPSELMGIDPVSVFRKIEAELRVLTPRDVLLANLSSLLCAVNAAFLKKDVVNQPPSKKLGDDMIQFINENILTGTDISALSAHIHLSPSQTCRVFKEATGSSVYHYILLKRLILAREMIASGESAKNAALSCGFGDYSSFYRSYKKHFGRAPTEKQQHEARKESL